MYITEFEVAGSSRFPLDMLRYDGCHPASQEAVSRIDNTFPYPGFRASPNSASLNLVYIKLVSHHSAKTWKPTDERWKSFGWKVNLTSIHTRKV